MYQQTQTIPNLGSKILILMDNNPNCLEMIRAALSQLPDVQYKHFTLLHYAQPMFWEHGGDTGTQSDLQQQTKTVRERVVREYQHSCQCCQEAQTILKEAGVPETSIDVILTSDADSTDDAVMKTLCAGMHSGVILNGQQHRFLAWLMRSGLYRIFRRGAPRPAVWADVI